MTKKVKKGDQDWRESLSEDQFHVLRQCGTERAFTGKYWNEKAPGTYVCAGCGQELFSSLDKFDSGSGWPSFTQPLEGSAVDANEDRSHGMIRVELSCSRCDGHLGHIFPDGPQPTGERYCINSTSLDLIPKPEKA
jgi:peptide-methionine (R)-S-oxide reductase